jgi:CheY-like chemotaxis protein
MIVIVEDSEDLRDLFRCVLEDDGLTVATAASGQEALACLLQTTQARLALLDMSPRRSSVRPYGHPPRPHAPHPGLSRSRSRRGMAGRCTVRPITSRESLDPLDGTATSACRARRLDHASAEPELVG